MIRLIGSLADRMVGMVAPKVTAQAATCQYEACCDYKRKWYCCYNGNTKTCTCQSHGSC